MHVHDQFYKVGEKNAWLGIISNLLLFAFKIFAGVYGRSQAMIADAFHTLSDALTSIGVLVGFMIAKKPADKHHPFGHGRAESIAAKIVAIVLILIGIRVAITSARVFASGEMTSPGAIALVAALVSIVVKEISYRYVIAASEKINSASLRADAYHHRSDVLSSVAALIGIGGAMMGWRFLDPLAGIIVAGFIIKIGTEVFHMAYDELMDAAPPEELQKQIVDVVMACNGVGEVKKVMVRKSGIELFLEVTIGVDGRKTVSESHKTTAVVKKNLEKAIPNIEYVIVHVEPMGKTDENRKLT